MPLHAIRSTLDTRGFFFARALAAGERSSLAAPSPVEDAIGARRGFSLSALVLPSPAGWGCCELLDAAAAGREKR